MEASFVFGMIKGLAIALVFLVIGLIVKGVLKGTKIAHEKVKNALMSDDEKSNKI